VYSCKAVGDADAHPFLATNDGPDARSSRRFDEHIGRIAAKKLDPLALEDFRDRVDDFHMASPTAIYWTTFSGCQIYN
jgi:hypothetical protein